MPEPIREHNKKAAAMWGSGGRAYDAISRSIADATEHCVIRLNPSPGEYVADVATGTGWTCRAVTRRGAGVSGHLDTTGKGRDSTLSCSTPPGLWARFLTVGLASGLIRQEHTRRGARWHL